MNFHERLENDYGTNCLRNIRLSEKTKIKQLRIRKKSREIAVKRQNKLDWKQTKYNYMFTK